MKICIDAGHNYSGADTGAVGNGLREQDITFAIAEKLKNLFSGTDIQIVMTRNKLTDNLGTSLNSSLDARAAICNNNKCDYFISIHCNAGGGTGSEVYVYKFGGEAQKLANVVADNICSDLELVKRGVKEGNFAVLRNTNCPAILVETAFIDNQNDASVLKNKQAEFASAIYKSVLKYLGINEGISIADIKKFLTAKWNLSEPADVFNLLDKHPYKDTLYKKIYDSYM